MFSAKGRTNIELREQFILAEGVSQSMAHFVSKTPKSPSGVSKSPSSSQSGGSSVSWSGRSASSASGPITKVSSLRINWVTWLTTLKFHSLFVVGYHIKTKAETYWYLPLLFADWVLYLKPKTEFWHYRKLGLSPPPNNQASNQNPQYIVGI